jgi:hypothetical protein
LPAASAGAELPLLPLAFISIVLDSVINAVPAAPAKSPLPIDDAILLITILISFSSMALIRRSQTR